MKTQNVQLQVLMEVKVVHELASGIDPARTRANTICSHRYMSMTRNQDKGS